MKTTISFIVGVLLMLVVSDIRSEKAGINSTVSPQKTINITCDPELYELTSGWAGEYNALHPDVNVRVLKSTGTDADRDVTGISGIFLGMSGSTRGDQAFRSVVVGRNVTVVVMNRQNPFKDALLQTGISPEEFAVIFNYPEKQNWGSVSENGSSSPLRLYLLNDEATKTGVAKFLKTAHIPETGITLGDKAGVLTAVQNDPYALGFCNLTDIASGENQGLTGDIILVPVDRNGNGRIDHMEDIYGDLNQLMRGIWIGKYPNALYQNIYAVSSTVPMNESETEFLKWMVTVGQRSINAAGYCDLVTPEIQTQLNRIEEASVIVPPVPEGLKGFRLILVILLAVVAAFITLSIALRRLLFKKVSAESPATPMKVFGENSFNIPRGLLFDKNHTWAFMESDGLVKIGMDDFIRHITGPITRIEMKNPGERIKKGELLFSINQSGKQLNMYAPVSGTIVKQNETLNNKSSEVNEAILTNGWIYMIEPSNWFRDMQLLEMADRYERFLRTEFARVKDFLAATLNPESPEYSHVVLQDGGQLMEGVLSEFGPEIWEDFQTIFLDHAR